MATNLLAEAPDSPVKIPTIDLASWHDPSSHVAFLEKLRHALVEVGFMYLSNHGVPMDVTDNLIKCLPELFSLSEKEKQEVALTNSLHFLGYSAVSSEITAGREDYREQFEIATELPELWQQGKPLYERLWPSALPKLRPVVEAYMAAMTDLADRFLDAVAETFALPPRILHHFVSEQHRLKLVHYPASPSGSGQGVGPHKDSSGWWTFLLQASSAQVKGLQVLTKQGTWIDVPSKPGTFVVNAGQAFEVISRGVCRATTHRVLATSQERFSVPFFQGVRRSLTKDEVGTALAEYFSSSGSESDEGTSIDSAWLRGMYDTWGESQLRTKIRSHRPNGQIFYPEVYEEYIGDDVAIK